MRTFEWAIEDIVAAYPDLNLDHIAAMAVALMKGDGPPCSFVVHVDGLDLRELAGETRFVLNVTWSPQIQDAAERMERTEQRTPLVERAAIGLAVLLLSHFVFDSELEVFKQKDRADFRLPKRNQAVEISGTERAQELPRRVREKRRQVLQNAFGLDGHVIVCCFEPGRRVIQWSYYTQPE